MLIDPLKSARVKGKQKMRSRHKTLVQVNGWMLLGFSGKFC